MTQNIRNDADRAAIEAKGYRYVTVLPRGDHKGQIVSKHRTYELAERAAKGRELAIMDVRERHF